MRSTLLVLCSIILGTIICTCNSAEVQTTNYRVKSTGEVTRNNNTLRNTNPDYVNKYRRIETYIPGDDTPVKRVKVSLNIFTGPGSLKDTEADKATLRQMMEWVNSWYINNAQPTDPLPGVDFIPDTKIRFEADDRIFFYDNTKLYNSCNVYEMEKAVKAADSTRMNYLNVYFTIGPCTQHSMPPWPGFDYYPTASGMNGNQYVLMPISVPMSYSSSQTLAHELGHSLDLMHLYEGSCCHETCDSTSPEYLDDVFGPGGKKNCWQDGGWHCDPADPAKTCTNNMMSGVATLGYYFSPKQIGKMHRALSIKTAKRYVKDDAFSDAPFSITGNESWDFEIRWYSDIVIKKGASLTLTSDLYMPGKAKITVQKGGKLVIDGGKIISMDPSQSIEIIRR